MHNETSPENHEKKRSGLKQALSAAGFLAVLMAAFLFFTYLFRPTFSYSRLNILRYYAEERNTVDVVLIGASSFYRFFNPVQAYEMSGITSYDYAVAGMQGCNYITGIRDVMRTQKPKLLLIDARRFTETRVESATPDKSRFYFDALDIGLNRMRGIWHFSREYDVPIDETLELAFDISLYHNNTEALSDPLRWKLADNRVDADSRKKNTKGFLPGSSVKQVALPSFSGEGEEPLTERQERVYREVCAYLAGLDTEAVMMVCAYSVTDDAERQFRAMKRIAEEYGIGFLDTNEFHEEIGYNYDTDFYNRRHTNLLGAEKFTAFLTKYLTEHYDLPDHRGDARYSSWDDAILAFHEKAEKIHKTMDDKIAELYGT